MTWAPTEWWNCVHVEWQNYICWTDNYCAKCTVGIEDVLLSDPESYSESVMTTMKWEVWGIIENTVVLDNATSHDALIKKLKDYLWNKFPTVDRWGTVPYKLWENEEYEKLRNQWKELEDHIETIYDNKFNNEENGYWEYDDHFDHDEHEY